MKLRGGLRNPQKWTNHLSGSLRTSSRLPGNAEPQLGVWHPMLLPLCHRPWSAVRITAMVSGAGGAPPRRPLCDVVEPPGLGRTKPHRFHKRSNACSLVKCLTQMNGVSDT